MKRPLAALLGAAAMVVGLIGPTTPASAQDQCTIALIPGLTTDAFYITMRKGAEMAAKAVGCELLFQGAPEFNPTLQVPVLQAPVLARALYAHAEIEREIPAALFAAVAQVLAYVYQLRAAMQGKAAMPQGLPALNVPAELDPHHDLPAAEADA